MRNALLAVAAAAAAMLIAVLPAVGLASGSATTTLKATLKGKAEVPKGSPTGSGTASISINLKTHKVCWRPAVSAIGKPLSAHVHKASAGKTGPVVIPLGARYGAKGCVIVPHTTTLKTVIAKPSVYYINVHTRKYLNGALRGQLHR